MTFNEEKFEALRCGPNQALKDTTKLLTEGGKEVDNKPHVKCLGVFLSENATFEHHIAATIKKARGMAGWILRTISSREKEVMLTLWRSMVQPLLDYCSQLWSPQKKGIIQNLETVQRSFTRNIKGMRDLSYWDRLNQLGLYSQQRRRDRYCAIYLWKVLEKLVPDPTDNKLQGRINNRTGRKCERWSVPTGASVRVKSLLTASLGYNGPRMFNSLPQDIRNKTGCSVHNFKKELDKFLKTLPDEPPVQGYTVNCRAASNSIPDQMDLLRRDGSSGGAPRL
ncbi:hypothetical protein Pcinc_019021 [Petrolisthes cinctipes]|uniref:Reverse transcriptase n=1 Tax=Petrolisthes cinctipes TaxID=88211 RepID=A0AAE1KM33_PETCI|nr:hypothetical protein Pcinc_019021 [Petrolisthes cinctipes]